MRMLASTRTALAIACAVALGLNACGDPSGNDGVSSDKQDAGSGKDTGTIGDDDTATGDDILADDTGTEADAGTDTGADVPEPDIITDCPGQAGCDCISAKDCDSGFCIQGPTGQQCAALCVNDCLPGFKCATTTAGGGDPVNICVPEWGNLCNPCSDNVQCKTVGSGDAACIDRGDAGAFCGAKCVKDEDCPDTHACSAVKDVAGNEVSQCVPKGGAACACSPAAIEAKLSTACFVASGDQKCEGVRACLSADAEGAPPGGGLSACQAPEPIAEVCDGKDNDCDGDKDELTCDDNNPCTIDKCEGVAGCKHENAQGPCDADDSQCTKGDACSNGTCKPGKVVTCDDANACTEDVCDPKKGCLFKLQTATPCDADDNPCTTADACKEGICAAGTPKPCNSGDFCIQGKCSIATGKCTYKAKIEQPCNDGNACTSAERCKDESCVGKVVLCDDNNACTDETCDPKKGCTHTPTLGSCDDGDKCTKGDACTDGKCLGLPIAATTVCDDNNACTKDTCKAADGCVHQPMTGQACDDGISCSEGDACKLGKCTAGNDVCGCKTNSDCAAHDDGDACNGTLFCDTSKLPYACKVNPITVITCDAASSACQRNTCDPKTGKCALKDKPDTLPCDADGSLCSVSDACKGGQCLPGPAATCDDNNVCTDDGCDAKTGCTHKANAAPCDADGNKCTHNDTCSGGACVAGKKLNCDDAESCTADACIPSTGACVHKPLFSGCEDGSKCTVSDNCGKHPDTGKHTCVPGKQVPCSDGKPCTFDSCDATKGCVFTTLGEGAACDDGNKCTKGDVCKSKVCQGAPIVAAIECDDKSACTTDTCDSKLGCLHKPVKDATACEDGDPCTAPDLCGNGKCIAGKNSCACKTDADCASKDDGNPCNGTLYCNKSGKSPSCAVDPKTVVKCDTSLNGPCQSNACDPFKAKCQLKVKPDGTSCDADGSKCTPIDTCQSAKCVAGKKLDCNDLNPCTIDSCDPAKGCVHIDNQGPCDADNDACSADVCKAGKCTTTGQTKSCDDNETCTADSCDKGSGGCVNKPLSSTCDDGNKCTSGDKCGAAKGGKYTCLPGQKANCDDANDCTLDACDSTKGCTHKALAGKVVACWTGDPKKKDVGICKSGKRSCKADGSKTACSGEVKPLVKEACNGKDDTCDGQVDEGCKPAGFVASVGNVSLASQGSKYRARVRVGAGFGGVRAGNKVGVHVGWLGWLRALTGGK